MECGCHDGDRLVDKVVDVVLLFARLVFDVLFE